MATVGVKWVDSKLMIGADSNGHTLVVSSWPEREPQWKGVKPSDLLLIAAASCSLYDVVNILMKQREPLQAVEVSCHGEQNPDPPYAFNSIHLHYRVVGPINAEKLERAIHLSQDKYCSVINTIKSGVAVTSDFEIVRE